MPIALVASGSGGSEQEGGFAFSAVAADSPISQSLASSAFGAGSSHDSHFHASERRRDVQGDIGSAAGRRSREPRFLQSTLLTGGPFSDPFEAESQA